MSTTAITSEKNCANWTLNLSCCHCFWFHTGTIGIALLGILNAFWSTFDALNFMSFKQTHNTQGASISHLFSSLIFVLFTVLLLVVSIKLLAFSFWPFILYAVASFLSFIALIVIMTIGLIQSRNRAQERKFHNTLIGVLVGFVIVVCLEIIYFILVVIRVRAKQSGKLK
ncbi:hypothetical protein M3Y96_00167300 [Aphelenchoides besseyi]|nr:hypothetical protein M3Y96_00167300 [Aphelenchoides besseyi]